MRNIMKQKLNQHRNLPLYLVHLHLQYISVVYCCSEFVFVIAYVAH